MGGTVAVGQGVTNRWELGRCKGSVHIIKTIAALIISDSLQEKRVRAVVGCYPGRFPPVPTFPPNARSVTASDGDTVGSFTTSYVVHERLASLLAQTYNVFF